LDVTLLLPDTVPTTFAVDYVEQLQVRLREAYAQVNDQLRTNTQRMKRRYDARVKSIQLEPDSFAFYYCPRRKTGRYKKWSRLCQVCRIVQRFNDVTYSIQLTLRSKPFIAHVDRLRPFDGEIPSLAKETGAGVEKCEYCM
jgi:hypothetical protein